MLSREAAALASAPGAHGAGGPPSGAHEEVPALTLAQPNSQPPAVSPKITSRGTLRLEHSFKVSSGAAANGGKAMENGEQGIGEPLNEDRAVGAHDDAEAEVKLLGNHGDDGTVSVEARLNAWALVQGGSAHSAPHGALNNWPMKSRNILTITELEQGFNTPPTSVSPVVTPRGTLRLQRNEAKDMSEWLDAPDQFRPLSATSHPQPQHAAAEPLNPDRRVPPRASESSRVPPTCACARACVCVCLSPFLNAAQTRHITML